MNHEHIQLSDLGKVSIVEPRIITAEDFNRVSITDSIKAELDSSVHRSVANTVARRASEAAAAPYEGKPEHRAYVPRKCEMLDRARAEGKKGALFAFKSGTKHGIMLNGEHRRVYPKLTKAQKKAAKRVRIQERARVEALDAEQREES